MNDNFWFIGSILLLFTWLILWLLNERLRKTMLVASLLLLPTGLAQILFVPKYWNPPSFLNLNSQLGFDIESLVFSFAVGGISVAFYELFVIDRKFNFISKPEDKFLIIVATTLSLFLFIGAYSVKTNPIHSFILALFAGAILIMFRCPKIIISSLKGGVSFMFFYVSYFFLLKLFYPHFVSDYWNLSATSKIQMAGIPLEEVLYSFGFGVVWFMIYILSVRRYVFK